MKKQEKFKENKEPKYVHDSDVLIIVISLLICVLAFCALFPILLPFVGINSKSHWLIASILAVIITAVILKWFLVKIPFNHAYVVYDHIFNTSRVLYHGLRFKLPTEKLVENGDVDFTRDKILGENLRKEFCTQNNRWITIEWIMPITPHKYYLFQYVLHTLDGAAPVFEARVLQYLSSHISKFTDKELLTNQSNDTTKQVELSNFHHAFKSIFGGDDIEDLSHTDQMEREYGIWTKTPKIKHIALTEDAKQADMAESEAESNKRAIKVYTDSNVSPDNALAAVLAQTNDNVDYTHISITGIPEGMQSLGGMDMLKGASRLTKEDKPKKGKGKK